MDKAGKKLPNTADTGRWGFCIAEVAHRTGVRRHVDCVLNAIGPWFLLTWVRTSRRSGWGSMKKSWDITNLQAQNNWAYTMPSACSPQSGGANGNSKIFLSKAIYNFERFWF
jgi:hypothetical protein